MKEKLMTSEDALYYAYSSSDANIICGLSSVTAKGNDTAPPSGCFHGFREHSPSLQQVYANPVVRQLLIEMHIVFEKCQQLSRHEPLSNQETISISREYRSALLHCANEIEEDENMYIRDFTIWSLFETMFFQRGNTPICLDLISWGIDSFIFIDKVVQKASKELDEGISVGDGSYWRAVCLVLIGCRFDICIDFLALLKDDKAAGRFRSLLSSFEWSWMMDVGEMSKLDRWKHELSCLLTSGALNSNKNVLFLAQLLNGDRKYLERAASAVVSEWWHLVPFYVFVKNFSVAYNELGALAKECRDLFKTVNDFKDEEFDPFLSILTMEDINVLQNVISNPWLSVHLIDTLLHTDKYDNLPTLQEARDFLLMEYGSGLIQNSSLWEIGANYLVYCGSEGRLRLENHIEAMHIDDEAMAEALMRLCEEHELDDSKACIVNSMTYRYLREEEWSSALSWALRGGRGTSLDIAVNRIIWQADKDKLATLSALDHLADYVAELESPSLAFLFNYYRFHRSLSAGDVRSGIPLLVSMIISPNVPQSFHKVLFGYLMLLLSDIPQIQIPLESIHELIAFFRQYTIDNAADIDISDDTIQSIERLLLMQLSEGEMISAAAKNLKVNHVL